MIHLCCQQRPSLTVSWTTLLKEPGFSGLVFPLLIYNIKVVSCQYQVFYIMSPIYPVQKKDIEGVYWHIVWHCHDPWVAENRHPGSRQISIWQEDGYNEHQCKMTNSNRNWKVGGKISFPYCTSARQGELPITASRERSLSGFPTTCKDMFS